MSSILPPIIDLISVIKEPRKRGVCYAVEEIVLLVISGVFAGCTDWKTIEEIGRLRLESLRKYFPYLNGTPCYMTISRLMSIIDPKEMNRLLYAIAELARNKEGTRHVALDGKHIGKGLYTVSAYATEESLVLKQSLAYSAGNELANIREVLKGLTLNGCIVTMDSIAAHRDIIETIKEKKGEAIIGLKGNQKYLHLQVKNLFALQREKSFEGIAHTYCNC